GGVDKTIRLWDVLAGQEVRQLPGHQELVTFAAFTADGKALVSGGADSMALVWDLTATVRDLKPRPAQLNPGELDSLFADLASDDAAGGYQAVWSLGAASAQAVALLRERVPRATVTDETQRIAKLITDLDNDEFAVRESATRDLQQIGKPAEAALRQALER